MTHLGFGDHEVDPTESKSFKLKIAEVVAGITLTAVQLGKNALTSFGITLEEARRRDIEKDQDLPR